MIENSDANLEGINREALTIWQIPREDAVNGTTFIIGPEEGRELPKMSYFFTVTAEARKKNTTPLYKKYRSS